MILFGDSRRDGVCGDETKTRDLVFTLLSFVSMYFWVSFFSPLTPVFGLGRCLPFFTQANCIYTVLYELNNNIFIYTRYRRVN